MSTRDSTLVGSERTVSRRWAIRRRGIPESRWNEHDPILRLMRAHDRDGAAHALKEHLQTTLLMLRRHVPHSDESFEG